MPRRTPRPPATARRRTRTGLGALLGLAAALSPLSPAAAADTWTVPADATIVVRGHGNGHGHGMSQYGAEGAARAGLDYQQIASFYYPGTAWGSERGLVSVLISADTTDDVVVLARTRLKVADLATGEQWLLPQTGVAQWRLRAGEGAATVVSYRTGAAGTGWRRWKVLTGDGEFYAGGKPIDLVLPAGARAYRGRLRAASPTPGTPARDTVNVLTLDNYLRGVVPLEMPASWSADAVRAQAVAARTYAAYERAHPRATHYQICDTTSCQVYGGYDAEQPGSDAAVAATQGQVLTTGDEPAFTQFSSSSGGWTAAGSAPYLGAQPDPYDAWDGNPVHDWTLTFSDEAIEARFPAIGNLTKVVVTSRDGNGDWGGRVLSLTLTGSNGKVTLSGDAARSALGLRSTWFTFRIR